MGSFRASPIKGASCKDVRPPESLPAAGGTDQIAKCFLCYLHCLDLHFLRGAMISLPSLEYPFQKLGETSCVV